MITMLWATVWWLTFVVWGRLHGLYLTANHVWRIKTAYGWRDGGKGQSRRHAYFCSGHGLVFRRKSQLLIEMISGMLGMNGWSFSKEMGTTAFGVYEKF
jgi:hypothetical protein